jgi:hypothetical protein
VDVLVVLRPGSLARTAPDRDAVDVLDDPLGDLFGLGARGDRGERLDLLQESDEVVRVAQEDLVQLPQRLGRGVEQALAALDGAEPVRLEELRDLGLHFLLLRVEAALATLDPGDEVPHRHAQGADDRLPPCLLAAGPLRRGEDLGELGAQGAGEERQALPRERLVGEEVLDDGGCEAGERIVSGAHDPGAVHASEHPLLAQALDRVRRPLAGVVGAGFDDVADLLEHVDERVLLERGERGAIGAEVQSRQEAEVDGLEIQEDLVTSERGDEAARVRGGHLSSPGPGRCGDRARITAPPSCPTRRRRGPSP